MSRRENTSLFHRGGPGLGLAALVLVAAAATPRAQAKTFLGGTPQSVSQTVQDAAQQQAAADYAQKVQDLINKTEASYHAGVDDYNANKLDAARMDFDSAVDGMLSSGMDLKNDPQLADEFDQLLSRINSLELVALKQGNGFSPKVEEAPVDAANDVTFAPDAALVSRVTAELKTTTSDLPLVNNEYVSGWIDAFANKPTLHAHLVHSLERAGKYKAMIQKILADNGVPQDLIYQAITESGFQPQVLNRRSGAGGMWQFMPFGNYGLARNGYFDERFDPVKSTIAYAKYMKYLYSQFGDWYLAMAAYDWGPGRVQHVVARTGYADYWELYRRADLPAETKAYIPSVIAAVIMAHNPQQYGLTDVTPDPAVTFDTVTTDYAIDLRLVADLTGSTVADIVALNPALLRLSTPNDIPYDLHIPSGTLQEYKDRLQNIPEEHRASWRFHVVKAGETLDQIADTMHSHASEIAEFNELKPAQPIEEGDELVVPVAASPTFRGSQRYTLRRNDTLVTVADRFGVTVEQLREWNHLKSSRVAPGHSLYVSEPIRLAPTSRAARGRHSRRSSHTSVHSGSSKDHTSAKRSGAAKRSSGKKRAR
ncbi:lytic transglycosylase domain-containing protein [Granulicella sp. 5B5]|uniref:lytic transglycosylase domain-containing protein n=1 Tax=Granulicella sp. 5B5 TaxID=1617967 RepID=UPI0021074380|nr:lytic transglycosylase domain-containing protein [Granulicella sp. 5B5]